MAPQDTTVALPSELLNLLALHSSFLTALSLHYAHNGIATPVDLSFLTESVSKVWRLRKVTYDDIRLCIGVLESGPTGNQNPFYLSDYGGGKICLEIREENKFGRGGLSVSESALKEMFMVNLDALWTQWTAPRVIATPKKRGRPRKADSKQTKQASIQAFVSEPNITKFIAQLPHAEITTCSSLAAIAPLQEKGRKRLREFKESVQQGRSPKKARGASNSIMSGKENSSFAIDGNQQIKVEDTQTKMTDFASVRKTALLDRILEKQALAASSPKPPSPAELARNSALQRSEEALNVLSLLCATKGSGSRVSFSMNTLLQALQNSIRSPISRDEALKCVEVLAAEVTPGYVGIVRMGAISSVVINQTMRPVDIKGKLAALGVAM